MGFGKGFQTENCDLVSNFATPNGSISSFGIGGLNKTLDLTVGGLDFQDQNGEDMGSTKDFRMVTKTKYSGAVVLVAAIEF